jgi:hypothetical protein
MPPCDFVAGEDTTRGSTPRFDAYEETGSRVSCRHGDGVGIAGAPPERLGGPKAQPPGEDDRQRFASERRLIEPPRDLVAQGYELRRRMCCARARDRNVGENPCRTDR